MLLCWKNMRRSSKSARHLKLNTARGSYPNQISCTRVIFVCLQERPTCIHPLGTGKRAERPKRKGHAKTIELYRLPSMSNGSMIATYKYNLARIYMTSEIILVFVFAMGCSAGGPIPGKLMFFLYSYHYGLPRKGEFGGQSFCCCRQP